MGDLVPVEEHPLRRPSRAGVLFECHLLLEEDLYQLISNIGIFKIRARHFSYIQIYDSFEEPYIRIYGFLWSFCNVFLQPIFDITGLEFP
jgi:hypothetical protein